MAFSIRAVASGFATTTVSQGKRAGQGVRRNLQLGEQLAFLQPQSVGSYTSGFNSHLSVLIHSEKQDFLDKKVCGLGSNGRIHYADIGVPDSPPRAAGGHGAAVKMGLIASPKTVKHPVMDSIWTPRAIPWYLMNPLSG